MSTVPIDLGWRVEARDPSLPSGGKLVAVAIRTTAGWQVSHRDGRKISVDTRTEALLALGRMLDDEPATTRTLTFDEQAGLGIDPDEPHGAYPVWEGADVGSERAICAGCGRRIVWRIRIDPQHGQPAGGWFHEGGAA